MASEYSVNIRLNTAQVKKDLKTIGTEISNLGKKESKSSKKALSTTDKRLKTETQIANLQKRTQSIRNSILKLDLKGAEVSQIKSKLTRADNQAESKKFDLSKKNIALALRELEILKQQTIEVGKQAKARRGNTFKFPMGASSPLNFGPGGQLLPGSGRGMFGTTRGFDFQSALISGGFPLLFGQGPVGALAGGLGGGIGGMFGQMGGFAGGIVATAAVQSINKMIDSLSKLGQEMNKSAVEFKRVQDIVGTEGADSLSKFGSETKLLGDEFGKFTLRAQSGIAGLINITGILDGLIKGIQTRNLRAQIKDSTDPEIQALVKAGGTRTQGVLGKNRTGKLSQAESLQLEKNLRKQIREEAEKQQTILDQILLPLQREVRLNDETNEITKLGIKALNEKEDILNKIKAALKTSNMENAEITEEMEDQVAALVDSKYERLQNLQLGKEFAEKVLKPQMEAMEKQEKEDFDAGARLGKRIAAENKILENMEKGMEKSKLERELQKAKTVEERVSIQLKLIELGLGQSITDFNKEDLRTLLEKKIAYDDLNKALAEQERIIKEINFTLASSMSSAIKGLIAGTHNLNSALSSVLNKMADAMLNMGLFGNVGGGLFKGKGLLGTIFGGLLANGGPAKAGKSYIVGEQGPEMFTPNVSGMVTPNHALGGSTNIVVNVDASGTEVQGDDESSNQLGKLVGLAVQQELINQQRPGGLLSKA